MFFSQIYLTYKSLVDNWSPIESKRNETRTQRKVAIQTVFAGNIGTMSGNSQLFACARAKYEPNGKKENWSIVCEKLRGWKFIVDSQGVSAEWDLKSYLRSESGNEKSYSSRIRSLSCISTELTLGDFSRLTSAVLDLYVQLRNHEKMNENS